MINILGDKQIWTIKEVKAYMAKHCATIQIVKKLPDLSDAKENVIYFVETTRKDKDGYAIHKPYILAIDDIFKTREWAIACDNISSFNDLNDLPYYRKKKDDVSDTEFKDDVTDVLAQPLTETDIKDIVSA